jgi:hypothetical protein
MVIDEAVAPMVAELHQEEAVAACATYPEQVSSFPSG